jgi:pimeloyl-ACP methyl ester carboxylesterase
MGGMKKIFILHGWTYSTEKWQPFIKSLNRQGFEVVLLKIPGLTEKIDRVWDLDDYVDWLKKTLKKEREIILIGHSNGGRIALAYASKKPSNLERLILIDSAGIYHNDLGIKLKRSIFRTAAKIGKKITNSEKLRGVLYNATRETDYKDAPVEVRQTMANLISTDLTNVLKGVEVKTTLIWGRDDSATPLRDGRIMQKLLRNSKIHVLDARHSPMFTNTEEVVQIILEDLR